MIKIIFLVAFVISFLMAENFLNYKKDVYMIKEQNTSKKPLKRIKIPTH